MVEQEMQYNDVDTDVEQTTTEFYRFPTTIFFLPTMRNREIK